MAFPQAVISRNNGISRSLVGASTARACGRGLAPSIGTSDSESETVFKAQKLLTDLKSEMVHVTQPGRRSQESQHLSPGFKLLAVLLGNTKSHSLCYAVVFSSGKTR